MKKLFFLGFNLLLFTASFAQENDDLYASRSNNRYSDRAFKECNQIIIETTLPPSAALDTLADTFIVNRYEFEKIDRETRSIATDSKFVEFMTRSGNIKLHAQITSSDKTRIILTGQIVDIYGSVAYSAIKIKYVKSASFFQKCFKQMEAIAKAYPNGRVLYGYH